MIDAIFSLPILAALISVLVGSLIPLIQQLFGKKIQKYYDNNPDIFKSKILRAIFDLDKNDKVSYRQKISKSLTSLKNATGEIDRVIENITEISKEKEKTISELEGQLHTLSIRENELKIKIETMEKVPLESIKYFEDILHKSNRRDKKRDYFLFAFGVIITTIIAVILNIL